MTFLELCEQAHNDRRYILSREGLSGELELLYMEVCEDKKAIRQVKKLLKEKADFYYFNKEDIDYCDNTFNAFAITNLEELQDAIEASKDYE